MTLEQLKENLKNSTNVYFETVLADRDGRLTHQSTRVMAQAVLDAIEERKPFPSEADYMLTVREFWAKAPHSRQMPVRFAKHMYKWMRSQVEGK
jgi:hypothetical protein